MKYALSFIITTQKRMKKIFLCCLLAAQVGQTTALEVELGTANFQSADGKPYIEVYTHISAASVRFARLMSSKRMATIEILYLWKRDGAVVKADKFSLSSPQVDSLATRPNFIDMKRSVCRCLLTYPCQFFRY